VRKAYLELGSDDLEQVEQVVERGVDLVSREGEPVAALSDVSDVLGRLAVEPLDEQEEVFFLGDACLAGPGERRLPQQGALVGQVVRRDLLRVVRERLDAAQRVELRVFLRDPLQVWRRQRVRGRELQVVVRRQRVVQVLHPCLLIRTG
jgi:hypothetical protein